MEFRFEKLSRHTRHKEPCSVAIPFPVGELTDQKTLRVLDGQTDVPVQTMPTSYWPDGSIRWLLVHLLVDLPGNAEKWMTISLQTAVTDAAVDMLPEMNSSCENNPFCITEKDGRMTIDNGFLRLTLNRPGEAGFLYEAEGPGFHFLPGEWIGPYLCENQDGEHTFVLNDAGWEIEQQGAVKLVLHGKGVHRDQNRPPLMHGELTLDIPVGKPWIQLHYRVIHQNDEPSITLSGMMMDMIPNDNTQEVKVSSGQSNYRTIIGSNTNGSPIQVKVDGKHLLNEANEHLPETFYGAFWADWCGAHSGGVCISIRHAQQNQPKEMEVCSDFLSVALIPRGTKTLWPRGVSKTHTLQLHFHGPNTDTSDLDIRAHQFQMPDVPLVSPSTYLQSGAMEATWSDNLELDSLLTGLADSRTRAYGMFHWGDAPDAGYSMQGRGNGKWVWTNGEYDLAHAAMLLYTRTGTRRHLDSVLTAAQHIMDVDICHYDPNTLRQGGQVTHSVNHTNGDVTPSHEWVDGLLDFWHLTGNRLALDLAIGVGENIVRHLNTPAFSAAGGMQARETGWALHALSALYLETTDRKWIAPAERIVHQFEEWYNTMGGWFAPYTDHTVIRVPFMIAIAVSSLMKWQRIFPSDSVRRMMVEAVTDMVTHCRLPDGMFWYKELPSLQRAHFNPLVLGALACAYELSGDKSFLEAGLPLFRFHLTLKNPGVDFRKELSEDAVILWGNTASKQFAQYTQPLIHFDRMLEKAAIRFTPQFSTARLRLE